MKLAHLASAALLAVAVATAGGVAASPSPSFMELAASTRETPCDGDAAFSALFVEANAQYSRAKRLWAKMRQWANLNGIELIRGQDSESTPLKTQERACVKCLCKYQKDTDCGYGQLRDVVRTTFTFPTKEGLKKFGEELFGGQHGNKLAELHADDAFKYEVTQTKNAYRPGPEDDFEANSGYKDIKVMIKFLDSPIIIEIQLQLKEMHDAKTGHLHVSVDGQHFIKGHLAYKCQRVVDEWAKWGANPMCAVMKNIAKVWKEPAHTFAELLVAYEQIIGAAMDRHHTDGQTDVTNDGLLATLPVHSAAELNSLMRATNVGTNDRQDGVTTKTIWRMLVDAIKSHHGAGGLNGNHLSTTEDDQQWLHKKMRGAQGDHNPPAELITWLSDTGVDKRSIKHSGGFMWLQLVRDLTLQSAKLAYHTANEHTDKFFMAEVATYPHWQFVAGPNSPADWVAHYAH